MIALFSLCVYVYAILIIYEYTDNLGMEFKDLGVDAKAKEKKEFARIIGAKIRDARKANGFTQEKLAEVAGYDSAYIGHLETGRYSPSVYTVWRLAKSMKINISELLDRL